MTTSKISNKIKNRNKPKDVFITPEGLAKLHIKMTEKYSKDNVLWLDPFKNSGVYYNNFNTDNKDWCEILNGRDFLKYDTSHNNITICSNPPYSMINDVLKKTIELKPHVVSYLLGFHNITTKRLEFMENNGYKVVEVFLTLVKGWYGFSFIIIFQKTDKPSILKYDRKIWK
tara:strand:- start:763 stop:1278 length:516 start_codon:yes stop_codon:yes gene_type:complete